MQKYEGHDAQQIQNQVGIKTGSSSLSAMPAASTPTTDAALFDKNSAGVQAAMALLMAQMKAEPAPQAQAAPVKSAANILRGQNVAIVDDYADVLKGNAEVFALKYGAIVQAVHYTAHSRLSDVASRLMRVSILVSDFDLQEAKKGQPETKETAVKLYLEIKKQCEQAEVAISPPTLFVYSGREENRAAVEAVGGTFILKSSSMQVFDEALLAKFDVKKAT